MRTLELPSPLSNLQLELLTLYAAKVSEEDLYQIKLMIGNYFAEKASKAMDSFLDENDISIESYNSWADEHNRAKSRS